MENVIPAIENVIARTGVSSIDLNTLTEGHSDWYSDGLHPNAKGNAAIAKEIYTVVSAQS